MPAKKQSTPKRSSKKLPAQTSVVATPVTLFDRVVRILEQARANVVRAVNSEMVLANWLVGREIVQAIQGGEERAEYGRQVIKDLSDKLTGRYGRGHSETNLKYFRLFYQTYADRAPMVRPLHGSDTATASIGHKACDVLDDLALAVAREKSLDGFSPALSWSHYRTLLGVENRNERLFYEIEAERDHWSVPQLERQIHTCLFARLLKSKDKAGVLALASKGQEVVRPVDAIKHPYVLDFLDLPESPALHESALETAIVGKLQPFLLELGKGFAFVDRQHRVETESQHFYIDLVFYNYLLKCFVLIDLKIKKLTHQDIGQMDMYVRMFDELRRGAGDNPTVGLILCAEKDEVMVQYSVLKGSQQLFASKYMTCLPSEEELRREIERERRVIEERGAAGQSKRSQ